MPAPGVKSSVHSTVKSSWATATGASVSSKLTTWVAVAVLPHASVAVHVRVRVYPQSADSNDSSNVMFTSAIHPSSMASAISVGCASAQLCVTSAGT